VLYPQTERISEWKVECVDAAQWARYRAGSWVRLRLHGWPAFYPVVRFATILE
jgi:hypothetical protein